jgi:DNA topoisomerase-2
MSPAEIKRGFFLCFNARFFPSLKFDSQTKERLTNSEAEVKAYLGEVNFEKLAKDILNTPKIIEPIIEAKLAKQIAAEKRAITLEQKKMTKKYVEKHIPAKSKKVENTVLLLTEGDSAKGMGEKVRDIEKHGFYPMRGCVMNTFGMKDKDVLENKELNDIMTILGLKFHMSAKEIKEELLYGKIGIMADGDLDGYHINSLVINFLSRWPELFKQRKVYVVTSPMYIFTKNKGKKNEERVYCYNKKEYEDVRDKYKGCELRYIKGLGSLRPKEYRDVLDNIDRWLCVELDDMKALEIMFSDNVMERRKIMGI